MKLTLLVPHGQTDDEVVETLVELASHDLLHPFGVVSKNGDCTMVTQDGSETTNLYELLAAIGRLDLVRVICLSLVGDAWTENELETINVLDKRLSEWEVPFVIGSITAPLKGESVDAGALCTYWNFNILMLPEDVLGEELCAAVPLIEPARRNAIGASAVALIGGLWRWLAQSPLDSVSHAGQGDARRVRLARVCTRVVDAGDLTAQAVTWALDKGAQLPPPPDCVRHGSIEQAVAALTEAIAPVKGISPLGFSYLPYEMSHRSAPKRMGLLATIRYFLKELFDELKPNPRQAFTTKVEQLKARVENAVQNRTFGADSDVVAKLKVPTDADLMFDYERRLATVDALPRLTTSPPVPSPSTWSLLTSVVLASADGIDMPKGMEAAQPTWTGRRAVISDLRMLADPTVGEPTEPLLTLSIEELATLGVDAHAAMALRPCDALAAKLLNDAASAKEPTPAPTAAPPTGFPPPVVSSSDPTVSDTLTNGDVDPPRDPGAQELPNTADGKTRERLSAWVRERERTLLWRVAARLSDEQSTALTDLGATQEELEALLAEITNATANGQRSRRHFVRVGTACLLLLLLLAVLPVIGFLVISAVAGLVLLGVFVLGLGGTLLTIVHLAAERVRMRHKLDEFEGRPTELFTKRQKAASEFARLGSLYEQYQDWAAVISAALHRPWGNAATGATEPWATDTGALSFSCGQPTVSQQQLMTTALGVAQRVATKGWMTRAYQSRRTSWLSWYDKITAQVAGVPDTPEGDCSNETAPIINLPSQVHHAAVTIYAPRSHFRNSFTAAEFADEYRAAQIETLRASVDDRNPASLIESVQSDVSGLTGRDAVAFLRPIIENSKVPGFARSDSLTPEIRMGGVGRESWFGISASVGATASEKMNEVEVLELPNRLVLAAFRLDLSEPIRLDQCTLVVGGESSNNDADDDADDQSGKQQFG